MKEKLNGKNEERQRRQSHTVVVGVVLVFPYFFLLGGVNGRWRRICIWKVIDGEESCLARKKALISLDIG